MGLGSGVATSSGVGHKYSLDPMLLWLGCRPAAVAPIGPLAWEFPYAAGAALKKTNEQKHTQKHKKKTHEKNFIILCHQI